MGRRRAVSVCGLVVAASIVVLAVGGSGAAQTQPETDHTVTHIQVHADGSATWAVSIRTRLRTSASVAEFEAFQRSFRENTSRYLDPFRTRIARTVQQTANGTGRTMQARNFTATTSIQSVPRRWGVVTYRFAWTNFAERRDGRLAVGDVFRGGFRLTENDTLAVSAPSAMGVRNVSPDPDVTENGTLQWHGERDFLTGRPRVVFDAAATEQPTGTPDQADGSGQPSPSPSTTATGSPTPPDGGSGGLLIPGAVAAVALGALVVLFVWRRGVPESTTGSESPTLEPLTDERRVRQLLEEHGGQMRQADVVEAVDWSKSKTSRVLSSMAEEGELEKVQLGRENVVRLPSDE